MQATGAPSWTPSRVRASGELGWPAASCTRCKRGPPPSSSMPPSGEQAAVLHPGPMPGKSDTGRPSSCSPNRSREPPAVATAICDPATRTHPTPLLACQCWEQGLKHRPPSIWLCAGRQPRPACRKRRGAEPWGLIKGPQRSGVAKLKRVCCTEAEKHDTTHHSRGAKKPARPALPRCSGAAQNF